MSRTWQDTLRSRGYRVTPQRHLVLEAVRQLDHATPDGICGRVRETAEGVNLSTVYRTLDVLEQVGLVAHTHLGQGSTVYHLSEEADHLHLVCRGCGAVADTPLDIAAELVGELRQRHGFEADAHHLTIFGRCQECRGET